MRKKEGIVVVAALLAMALTACGEQKTETAEPEQIQQSGTETVEPGKEQTEGSNGDSAQGEAETQSVIRYPMDFYGRYAINDQNIYFCYDGTIYSLNRKDDSLSILQSFAETGDDGETALFEGFDEQSYRELEEQLYLDRDYLYFLRDVYDAEKSEQIEKALWKIDTRTGEREQLEIPAEEITAIYVVDHQLYYWYYDADYNFSHEVYQLEEDGSVGMKITGQENDRYCAMPEGYTETYAGACLHFVYQSSHYEKVLLLNEEMEPVVYDTVTKEEQAVPSYNELDYYDGQHLVFRIADYSAGDGEEQNYYIDVADGEQKELDAAIKVVIGADQEGIYYLEKNKGEESVTPIEEELYYFSFENMAGNKEPQHIRTITKSSRVKDNLEFFQTSFLAFEKQSYYTMEDQDYDLDLYRTDWSEGEPVYQDCGRLAASDLEDLGEYTFFNGTENCPDCGKLILTYYLEGFRLTEKKAGDAAINEAIQTYMDENAESASSDFEEDSCDMHEDGFGMSNFREMNLTITYRSEDYIGFLWNGYDYWRGAAHGMPYRAFKLYDRNTGEELQIDEILETPEEELNKLIARKFEESGAGEELGVDLSYVWENVGYYKDHQFRAGYYYLNERGLVYYFGVYEIASYAAGMPSVEIPYEELQWKIKLY